MKLRATFQVKRFTNRAGSLSYRVTGTAPDGRRIRENYQTIEEATGRRQELEIEGLNAKPAARLKQTRLTDDQLVEAERAFGELGTRSLMAAVRFYLDNYREPVTKKPLRDAFDEFIASKQQANKRPDSITNMRTRVGFLVSAHGDKFVSDIHHDLISAIVHRPGRSPVTCDNDRRALSSFFSWATTKGYCGDNPMRKIEPITTDRGEPDILPLETVRKLLDAAQAFKDGVLVPYVALGLFAAIRPTELSRITWKDIDLEAGTVTLGAKLAKMRSRRIVELSENAVEWLLAHAPRRTPIKGMNWRRDFDAIKRMAEIKEWTQDIMRHTGVSHHLAQHEHEGKTATWAGNSPAIIQKHYKGLVKRQDTEQFWDIRPEDEAGKIVKLPVG